MFKILKELTEINTCPQPQPSVNLFSWTLREVLCAKQITNPYQTVVIAQLTQFFADDPSRNIEALPLSGAVISQELRRRIEELAPNVLEELVEYLLDCLQNNVASHDNCPLAWIQLAHAVQR